MEDISSVPIKGGGSKIKNRTQEEIAKKEEEDLLAELN